MKYQRFLDVGQSADLPMFKRRLVEFANDMGFGIMSATLVIDRPGRDPIFATIANTPESYSETFNDAEECKRDPVMRRLKQTGTPFCYDQPLYVNENCGAKWEKQAKHGYRTGIATALHLPRGRHFLLGFDRVEPLPMEEEVTKMLANLQLLAVHAEVASLRVLNVADEPIEVPILTPRELEVLRWTMEGKSAWSAGQIMSISENTVKFHLKNVLRKMDCTSKYQAVVKGISFGLL